MTRSRPPRRPAGKPPQARAADTPPGERIAKVLARHGVASRRGAEELIAQGRVSVDGKTLSSPAFNVLPGQDIRLDGEPIAAAEPVRMFRYHKPPGLLVTRKDPEGRPTIYDELPAELPAPLMPIGRLDFNSEGLLLLTNDGEVKRALELPSTGWTRRYRARAYGKIVQAQLDTLANGVIVDGERFGAIEATLEGGSRSGTPANVWITVALKEGRNREVRRALETLGLVVNRLIRVAYGPFQLGALERGEVAEIPAKMLREQLGSRMPVRPQ